MQNEQMQLLPIQITPDAILIPREYLNAEQFSIEIEDDYIVLRPKAVPATYETNDANSLALHERGETSVEAETDLLSDEAYAALQDTYSWIGSAEGLPPDLSARVREVVATEFELRAASKTKQPQNV